MNETQNQTSERRFRLRNVSWWTIVLAIITISTFFAVSGPRSYIQYAVPMGGGVRMESGGTVAVPPSAVGVSTRDMGVSGAPSQEKVDSSIYYPYPYPSPEVPVTDTREFLKVHYGANMRTRDVQGLTRRVVTTVRGYEGRIDQETSSSQYGFVSFVVPQSKYEAFRGELEGLVGSRFLTLNISSENLLPQKLSIEEQQKQADTTLSSYKTARQKLVNVHVSTVNSLQSRIDADEKQLAVLRTVVQTPEVVTQIEIVSSELASLKQQLASENASYTVQLKNADNNIRNAEDWVKAVQTQDQKLLDNVATVSGTVSIQWISYWECARLFLPGYWIPFIFLVLTVFSFLNDRRRFART